MNRKLTGFLNIIGLLILLAWAPGASAASWSTAICNPPPTYGPYNISGGKMYYCPAAGSFSGTSVLAGAIAGTISSCSTGDCVIVIDKITLADAFPNTALQCIVPGNDTCKNPGKCGGSSGSSGNYFFQLIQVDQKTSTADPQSCSKQGKNGPIKCQKTNLFTGLEGNAQAAALYCPNDGWTIRKQLYLRAFVENTVEQYDNSTEPPVLVSSDTTTLYCELLDPKGHAPDEYPNYSPDLNTPTNNSYSCVQQ